MTVMSMAHMGLPRRSPARVPTIGIVVPRPHLYGPSAALSGVESAADEAGYGTVVVSVSLDREKQITGAVAKLAAVAVDAIVVIAPHLLAEQAVAGVSSRVPLVLIGSSGTATVPVVAVNQYQGARLATEYLLRRGHGTVWHLAGPEGWVEARERERGWRETLERHGAVSPPVLRGDWSAQTGYEAGRYLAREVSVEAVFAANDQMAFGLVRALADEGIEVPGDVRVVGFDDVPEAAYTVPSLTTVRQNFAELGRRALEACAGKTRMLPGEVLQLEPELLIRGSTTKAGLRIR